MKFLLPVLLGLIAVLFACHKDDLTSSSGQEILPAGINCTVHDETSFAFSYRINGLSSDQNLAFFVGNSFFQQNWVEAPSSTTARDGLGPLFNTKSCSSCHFMDGRGKPFAGEGLLLRLSLPNGQAEPTYGGQFQDFSISTAQGEGDVLISYTEMPGQYADGTPYSLRNPQYSMINLHYGPMDPSVLVSPRVGNQMIGLGLLEIIAESDILSYADEGDADGDGISGRPNYVYDQYYQALRLGRFGWKANTPSIAMQVAAAFNGDIGIKTSVFPDENHTVNQSSLNGLPDGGVVEITDEDLEKVILYCRTLAVPNHRDFGSGNVQAGLRIFRDIGCAKCHRESYTTGNEGSISALKSVKIYPYTDMLLHDMGEGLADHRPDGQASGLEWKTPPLWGIGLFGTVNGHTFLLHDGRARSIEEAILWHGGEAEGSKNAFRALEERKRSYVLDFLRSL